MRFKHLILAAAMIASVPAFAQEATETEEEGKIQPYWSECSCK